MSPPEPRRAAARQVVGLAIRTTNAAEADPATARIPELWGRYSSGKWAERLEDLGAVGPTLAVYSRYESDVSGSYQLLVGRELKGSATVLEPLETETIPPGQYLTFSCPGPLPQAVLDGWRRVWTFFERPDAPSRAYSADFEVYSDSQPVDIWVAIHGV